MLPLPTPARDGSLHVLANLLRTKPDSDAFILIAAWLIGTLHPEGPYTHLNLRGQQGSGKSTATRMLRALIDPNTSPTRLQAKTEESLVLAATHGHILALENMSHLPPWLSDLLCGLSTGIGLSRRTLYSDSDESLFYVRKPVILNGITEVVTRGDLLDRLISVELPGIDEHTRKRESAIWEPFRQAHPIILGALLDAASMALRRQNDIVLEALPRMGDFAVWVEAASPSLGWEQGQFLQLYNAQKADSAETELEASAVATALLAYLRVHREVKGVSASDLLLCLEPYHTHNGTRRPAKSWPENGDRLGRELSRIAPVMRQRGYAVGRAPGSRRDGRKWQVLPLSDDRGTPAGSDS